MTRTQAKQSMLTVFVAYRVAWCRIHSLPDNECACMYRKSSHFTGWPAYTLLWVEWPGGGAL